MIWVRGAIVPDDELKISVLDRTFEHGLGLFETLRTWNGHPTLLGRHLERMKRSAAELRLPLEPADLPDSEAVAALLRAEGHDGDRMLRITMSGGLSESSGAVVWMRSAPLPADRPKGVWIGEPWVQDDDDPLAAHKSLNYWRRRRIYERALADGFDEAVSMISDCTVSEGTRTNIFLIRGDRIETPMLTRPHWDGRTLVRPIVPGIMRGLVLERAGRSGLTAVECALDSFEFQRADEVFLTNSVRGIIAVSRFHRRDFVHPPVVTLRLWRDIRTWLESGGNAP
jgi:branched-subunit amino acid aminotransferase/4-amino-4-deoxychorismate lyase